MPTPIALLCAWCGTKLREGPPLPARASHGICGICLERFLNDPAPAEQEREASSDPRRE